MEIYKGDSNCVLCRQSLECRAHLFFERFVSIRIWRKLMCWCLFTTPIFDCDHIIQWGENYWKEESLRAVVCKLILGALVY